MVDTPPPAIDTLPLYVVTAVGLKRMYKGTLEKAVPLYAYGIGEVNQLEPSNETSKLAGGVISTEPPGDSE
jgi:hypothetical protein